MGQEIHTAQGCMTSRDHNPTFCKLRIEQEDTHYVFYCDFEVYIAQDGSNTPVVTHVLIAGA